jgi:hypothetical protein
MNEIRALWPNVEHKRLKELLQGAPMLLKFYSLVSKDLSLTDQILMQRLYKGSKGSGYKLLKARFKKLIVSCIRANVGRNTHYQDAYIKGLRGIESYKALFRSNQRKLAIIKAKRIFSDLAKCTFTDLSIIVLMDLIFHYKVMEYTSAQAEKYSRQLGLLMSLMQYESEIFQDVCDLRREIGRTKGIPDKKVIAFAKQAELNFLKRLEDCSPSYRLMHDGYSIRVYRRLLERSYEEALDLCAEAKEVLSQYPARRPADELSYDLFRIEIYIQSGNYALAESMCNRYLMTITYGSYNWLVVKLYLLLSLLRRGALHQVVELATEMHTKKLYSKTPSQIQECWNVFYAYANFAVSTQITDAKDHPPFRINKLLNEVPFYSKDKQGLNVSILIIQFLFLLKQKRYMEIEDKAASLAKYNEKYLKRGETFRQHCFLRMLLEIVKADFNKIRAQRYAAPILEKMKTEPIRLSQQSIEVEIIPYEDLWEMTLKLLD